jgi:hypothetical protein
MLITETKTVKQFSDESEFESTLSFSLEKSDVEDWVVVENDAQELSLSLINWMKLVQIGNKIISNKKSKKVGEYQQELFNYLHDLGVIPLQSEMQDIERIVLRMQNKIIIQREQEVDALIDILNKCKEYFLLKNDSKSDEKADAISEVLKPFKNK